MARPLRIEFAGGLYHVTARGDRRGAIYFSDEDRRAWLRILGDVCARFHWQCLAWCQMTNHYHLVVETPEANLAQGMRQLNGVYTQRFNRSHDRVGHVFQGRYHAVVIEKDAYLLEVARYVVLNPVRAGMVTDPAAWRWSSYPAVTGAARCPDWLASDMILAAFGPGRATAVRRYEAFVRQGIDRPAPWDRLQGQLFLGSEAFAQRLRAQLPTDRHLSEIPRAQRQRPEIPLATYAGWADRKQAMVAAYRDDGYSMKDIAAAFGVHYATVSRAIRADEERRRHA